MSEEPKLYNGTKVIITEGGPDSVSPEMKEQLIAELGPITIMTPEEALELGVLKKVEVPLGKVMKFKARPYVPKVADKYHNVPPSRRQRRAQNRKRK